MDSLNLGLTGGIGCGKSSAVIFFAKLGWRTLQTDQIVRDLLNGDSGVRSQVVGRWGSEVLDSDQDRIDRKAVAQIVFKKPAELDWLEKLLHPKVRLVWEGELNAHPHALNLVEIPLLFEKRLETAFDLTVCVSSPSEIVHERMRERGYSDTDIRQRRANQLPLDEKVKRSDFVISNAGSLQYLNKQVQRLNEFITQQSPE